MNSSRNLSTAVVIVAAGRGERAGQSGGPKQYRMLDGKSILARTVSAFTDHPDIDAVLVVIHADDRSLYDASLKPHDKLLNPCIGGATRQASVLHGLRALVDSGVEKILLHDAARPFVDKALIYRVLAAIHIDDTQSQGALPVLPVSDTLKRGIDGRVEKTINRDNLFAAQTPQGFAYPAILAAHKKAARQSDETFTDDASIAEWAGIRVAMVAGDAANRKLTLPEDFEVSKPALDVKVIDVRTGNGYDIHAFEAGDHVRLCGVDISHTARLKGHSDADVGLHALTDALLGTIADGDIGSHFPPSDPKWQNANSEMFFKHAIERVRQRSGVINHLDVTLICEAPKIGPHRDVMRAEISRMSNISIDRVSVKATTNERIGSIGREEGIAAIATATVVF